MSEQIGNIVESARPAPELDSRSGLPRRDNFYQDIPAVLERIRAKGGTFVLLVIDVIGLEFVLRTFGPQERDNVVRDIGHRIRETAGADSLSYHITQGRFALVLPEFGYAHALEQANELVAALDRPFEVAGVSYHLKAFTGISQFPNHASTLSELVRTAVFACHQARKQLIPCAAFDKELDEWERYRFRLMTDLEMALKRGEDIELAYQPVVDLATGRCEGMEGLCRWTHSELGAIAPNHFLPYVEQTPLMMPLTEATISIGLRNLSVWSSAGFSGSLAINLSTSVFRHPDLIDRLLQQLRFYNIRAERLHFEITETGIMEHPERAVSLLTEIRKQGSRISVDDFGTGHSSLAYLADLPIDTIKIDRHFVQNISCPWGEAIISATATLADKLGLKTVAEGIEDEAQYRKCLELGINYGQGYYIARPMPEDDFRVWIDSRDGNRPGSD
ncbi:MAG: GGDEF domain-containing phosphodiesterase [Pseudohongiellaceae bacterium]